MDKELFDGFPEIMPLGHKFPVISDHRPLENLKVKVGIDEKLEDPLNVLKHTISVIKFSLLNYLIIYLNWEV